MSASCYPVLHHEVQEKFSSGTSSPGRSQKKGCKTVVCGTKPRVWLGRTSLIWLVSCWVGQIQKIQIKIYIVPDSLIKRDRGTGWDHHHNHFMALFPGPPGWTRARRELLDFMVQGKIKRDRHTDHPAGRHSIRTNQCPPSPSPHFFTGRMPFLPPNSVKALKATSAVCWVGHKIWTQSINASGIGKDLTLNIDRCCTMTPYVCCLLMHAGISVATVQLHGRKTSNHCLQELVSGRFTLPVLTVSVSSIISDIAVFVLKRDVKLQLTSVSSRCKWGSKQIIAPLAAKWCASVDGRFGPSSDWLIASTMANNRQPMTSYSQLMR